MRIQLMAVLALLAAASGYQMAAAEDGAGEADRAEQHFKRLDRDGDGQITRDEAEEGKRGLFERLLREADKDKNEKLSKDEFMAGMKALRPDRPGERAGERVAERVAERAAERGERKRDAAGGPVGAEGMFKRLDANRDGKVEKSEVPEQLQPLFSKLLEHADSDKDGTISTAEFEAVKPRLAERLGHGDFRPNPENLFNKLDINGDGELSKDEIAQASSSLSKLDRNADGKITRDEAGAGGRLSDGGERPRFQMIERVMQMDKNGDGQIEKEEARERLLDQFQQIDRNGDGKLDKAELQQYLAEILRRGGIQRGEERKTEDRKPDEPKPAERKTEERKSE